MLLRYLNRTLKAHQTISMADSNRLLNEADFGHPQKLGFQRFLIIEGNCKDESKLIRFPEAK